MSKKKLQVAGIMDELEGASLFFNQPTKSTSSQSPTPEPEPVLVSESNQETKPRPGTGPDNSRDSLPSSGNVSDPVLTREEQPIKQFGKNEGTTIEVTNEGTPERTNERYMKRRKIRHTFDIFADQLLSLREISIEEEKYTGERVLLGDLAQQALDMFISKQRNK